MKKNLLLLAAGAVLAYVLYDGYYYLQVLRWVDNIRIQQAIQQAAKPAAPPTNDH